MSEEQKTALPMRSGPGVAFVPGMTVCRARNITGTPNPGDVFVATGVDQWSGAYGVYRELWNAGCYDILSTPTQEPAKPADAARICGVPGSLAGAASVSYCKAPATSNGYCESHGGAKPAHVCKADRMYCSRACPTYVPAHVCLGWPCGRFGPVPSMWERIAKTTPNGQVFCSQQCAAKAPVTAPAPVCKGRPCGEAFRAGEDSRQVNGYISGYDSAGIHWFCSTRCRDAWKPEAKACVACTAPGRYGVLDVKRDELCGPCKAVADRYQKPAQPPAPPSPAPWKCSAKDCRTPSAPRGITIIGEAAVICIVCYDVLAAGLTGKCPPRFVPAPLPTYHRFDIPSPPPRYGWSHPSGWKPGDDSSIWSE